MVKDKNIHHPVEGKEFIKKAFNSAKCIVN